MNEVYKEKAKELLNEFMKFVEGDEHEEDKEDIDIRIRQNIGAVFMNAVILEIVDDNKKEILASGDSGLMAELFISEVILSKLEELKANDIFQDLES
jgi:Fic family protein